MIDAAQNVSASAESRPVRMPATAIVVVVVMFVMAIANVVAVAISLVLLARSGEDQFAFGQPIGDWYWAALAGIALVKAAIYFWAGQSVRGGHVHGWMLVNIIAVITAMMSVIYHPIGMVWVILLGSLLLLVFNNVPATRRWTHADM